MLELLALKWQFLQISVNNFSKIFSSEDRRGGSVGRAFASQAVGRGFEPRPGHTKDFKNGSSCSSLNAQHKEVELRVFRIET